MTNWRIVSGDILNQRSEVLVCSANPYLTLSGGVGGALLVKYGPGLQDELTQYLQSERVRKVSPGTLVKAKAEGTPYRFVLHAVSVDAAYRSDQDLIFNLVKSACDYCEEAGVKSMALTALATGYGPMSHQQFALSIKALLDHEYESLEEVVIGVRHKHEADEISNVLFS